MENPQSRFKLPQLPSFVWIILLVLGLVGFIGAIIGGFWALATVPGFASVIMLIAGFAAVWGAGTTMPHEKSTPFFVALGISFFALMGMAIDQVGNPIYNYPFRWFCPEGSQLERSVDVSHPLPGRTDIVQDFTCYDANGEQVRQIGMFEMIGVRFFEYVLIGYGIKEIGSHLHRRKRAQHPPISSS